MKLEKVIKGLECCEFTKCEECPYNEGEGACPTRIALFADALEAITGTPARVLTLEELNALPEGSVVWDEFMDEDGNVKDETRPSMKWGLWTLANGDVAISAEHSYGIRGWADPPRNWIDLSRSRWWSAKPTDEERKRVKWDE